MQNPSASSIKEKNLEKLSQNAQKMKELELEMTAIEKKIVEIKEIVLENKSTSKEKKEEIEQLYQKSLVLYEECNKKMKDRVNERFLVEFDQIGQRVLESETAKELLDNKKYELIFLLKELEHISQEEEERQKKLDEDYDELLSEHEYLRKNYDDISKENLQLNNDLMAKNDSISHLENKLSELKAVIGKLTEVRVILNQYFSSHFENFTANEKKIIEDVKNYRITDERAVPLNANTLEDSTNIYQGRSIDKSQLLNDKIDPNRSHNNQGN